VSARKVWGEARKIYDEAPEKFMTNFLALLWGKPEILSYKISGCPTLV